MREIKYRGKAIMTPTELDYLEIHHNKGWVSGNLIANSGKPYIVGDVEEATDEYLNHEFWVQVVPESLGQYTGLKDKNGREIYEKDVLDVQGIDYPFVPSWKGIVKFIDGSYLIENSEGTDGEYLFDETREVEIIGSIYENPELLEVKT